jgi:hypothetical protein
MIDLTRSTAASTQVQTVATDPGVFWTKDTPVAIEAPPDQDTAPDPAATWSADAVRTGICGAVGPRVIALPTGGYRIYYSQMLPRPEFPAGANDYANCTTRILSAFSIDGDSWQPESGVRLSSHQGGAQDFRVVSSEVVPLRGGDGLRMYYECCIGGQAETNAIRSAVSTDGGLNWTVEPGACLSVPGHNYSSPRILFLSDGRWRLYCLERDHSGNGQGIISAISEDGGTTFQREPGVRISQDTAEDALVAFASEIVRLNDGHLIMYYAGYSNSKYASILRATSGDEGLTWTKHSHPVLAPDHHRWDHAKASEMCIYRLPSSVDAAPRYRMVYEACDGTAVNQRGVWRIASASTHG